LEDFFIATFSVQSKYNLRYKQNNWIRILAIEADTAINQFNIAEQAYMRQMVAKKLQTIINNEKTQNGRRITHELNQETYEKRLIINIKIRLNKLT
jgi:phage terminase large subunit-like protein